MLPLYAPILLSLIGVGAETTRSAFTTRSWNCCKPSCSWSGVANVTQPVTACDTTNIPLSDPKVQSSCDGGDAYACANLSPVQINETMSYGFAGVQLEGEDKSGWCRACYGLTFTSGLVRNRTMVVQAVSLVTGTQVNTFDLFVCAIHTDFNF